jgi:hypothetical protein
MSKRACHILASVLKVKATFRVTYVAPGGAAEAHEVDLVWRTHGVPYRRTGLPPQE